MKVSVVSAAVAVLVACVYVHVCKQMWSVKVQELQLAESDGI